MATNWTAYDAAKELYGNNKELISEIGSRFPLFTRTVCLENSDYLLDILKAIPKVTARVVETGLKEIEGDAEVETETPKQEKEETKKEKTPKSEPVEEEINEDDFEEKEIGEYADMTAKELYKLCCERGISNKVASRKKTDLIEALEKYDNGDFSENEKEEEKEEQPKKEKKAPKAKKATKKAEPVEDDWDDEEEEESDPYKGKSAKELYKMCTDRGIKTKPRMNADKYAELLLADDAKKAKSEPEIEDDDDDDDWEI